MHITIVQYEGSAPDRILLNKSWLYVSSLQVKLSPTESPQISLDSKERHDYGGSRRWLTYHAKQICSSNLEKKGILLTKGDNVSVITLFEIMFQLERVNARSRWHNPTKLYAWMHTNVKRCVCKFLSTKCQIRGSPEEKIPVDCNYKIQMILRDLFHSQLEQPCKHFHNPCYSLTDWLSV